MLRDDTVKRALHEQWFLAPTTKQRLKYKDYLRVWGKDKILVPKALKNAFKEFNVCYLLTFLF
jgi:hypothetical protein